MFIEHGPIATDFFPILFFILAFFALGAGGFVIYLNRKNENNSRFIVIAFFALVVGLFIGTFVLMLCGVRVKGYDYYNGHYHFHHRSASWVAMGLSCGAMLCAALEFFAYYVSKNMKRKEAPTNNLKDADLSVRSEVFENKNYIVLSASANVGIGLWTSICASFTRIFGVESKNLTKKMNRATAAARARLMQEMERYPEFEFSDFRIIKDGAIAYTASVMGIRKLKLTK